jgi:hypothetical protein
LAKLASASSSQALKPDDATLTMALTGKNEIVGTLYYMSPLDRVFEFLPCKGH